MAAEGFLTMRYCQICKYVYYICWCYLSCFYPILQFSFNNV